MDTQSELSEIIKHVVEYYTECKYLEFKQKLHNSYIELMAVEADCRRKNASIIIKSIQTCDRELQLLKFEYGKLRNKYNIEEIPVMEKYIKGIERFRNKLVSEKNVLK